jgi:hypothetical protein
LEMLTLLILLRPKLGGIDGARILSSLLKIVTASALMGAVIEILMQSLAQQSVWTIASVGLAAGLVSFFGATLLLRSEEIGLAWRLVRSRV